MKKLLYFFILYVGSCLTGCDNNKTQPKSKGKHAIVKIKIINKTGNEHLKADSTISDKDDIAEFAEQIHAFKEVHDLNVKSSFGFYDVIVYKSDGVAVNYGVIYTVFDGIVIYNYNNNKMYKNNEMYNMMLHYLTFN